MAPQAAVVSYRLGGNDGVSVEARKWAWALGELGFSVRRVAGAFEDDGGPTTSSCRASRSTTRAPVDLAVLGDAVADADLLIVENVCSLPLNLSASRAVTRVAQGLRRARRVAAPRPAVAAAAAWLRWRASSRRVFPARCT